MASGFYAKIEDRYFAFLDWLDKAGIPVYKIVDPLESKGIPSLPVFLLILLLLIVGIFFALTAFFPSQAVLNFSVQDSVTNDAISGAAISIDSIDLKEPLTASTDSKGIASVKNVPLNKELTITISSDGYGDKQISYTAKNGVETVPLISLEKKIETVRKTIQLMVSGTNQKFDKDVSIKFECSENENFSKTVESSDGKITIDVPRDCGNLIATSLDSGATIDFDSTDLESNAPQIFLQAVENASGSVEVFVKGPDGKEVAGASVSLRHADSDVEESNDLTSGSGSIKFESIPIGTYYVVVSDGSGNFKSHDSKADADGKKELLEGKTITFNVSLESGIVGRIKVLAKDFLTKGPVENASIELRKNPDDLNPVQPAKLTNSDGLVEFFVGENVKYFLKINHPNYLIADSIEVQVSETTKTVELKPATSKTAQTLNVVVLDSLGKPVDNVKLVLKKAVDGTVVGTSVVTGANGRGEFVNLTIGEQYFVEATKSGFETQTSSNATIKEREINELPITLNLSFGNFEVTVYNEEKQAVSGAKVKAFDSISGEELANALTSTDGKALIENIRVDKTAYFSIEAEGFLPYYSIKYKPSDAIPGKIEITLSKDVSGIQLDFLGLYAAGQSISDSVSPGQKYQAKFLLKIPQNSSFNEAGIHVRTGNAVEGKTNIMEEDTATINNVYASTSIVKKGTSYTPSKGYGIDAMHLVSGEAKWANIQWQNVSGGTYEAVADIQVKDSVRIGDNVLLYYRGWAKTNGYLRIPKDDELNSSEATSNKQPLYANANLAQYSVGTSNLCTDSFCKSLQIEDISKHSKTAIIDSYPAKMSADYKLYFTISSVSSQTFANASIDASSETTGLKLKNYSIIDAGGKTNSIEVNNYSFNQPVGDIGKNSVITGTIEFRTVKDGLNKLNLSIKSAELEEILSIPIEVDVSAASILSIDVLPKEIIPFIDNQLLIKAIDSNNSAVNNAAIELQLNGKAIANGFTDAQGIFSYRLNSPNAGDRLSIIAGKTGYVGVQKDISISSSILLITPPNILEKLNPSETTGIESGLLITNQTAIPLKVQEAAISGDFKGLIDVRLKEDYVGKAFDVNSDSNIFIAINLTAAGLSVIQNTTLKGNLAIYSTNDDFGKTWVNNVPIEVRIALGESIDSTDCFSIDPKNWTVSSDGVQEKTLAVAVKNNCKVQNNPIDLKNLQLKIDWGSSNPIVQNINASSDDIKDSSEISLSPTYQTLAPTLQKSFTGTINLKMVPNPQIVSGKATPTITIKASNFTSNGEEILEQKLKTEIKINKISSCVVLKQQGDILLTTTPYGLGYSQYSNYGYDPFSSNGYSQYGNYTPTPTIPSYGAIPTSNPSSGYSQSYPYSSASSPYGSNPSSGYTGNMYTGYSGFGTPGYSGFGGIGNSFGYGEGIFKIQNNCTDSIEVQLDADPAISVDQSKITIDPNQEATIRVQPGYRMGRYNIDVGAKLSGSTDKTTNIGTVFAIVRRMEEISRDCVKLSPTEFDFSAGFSGFIGKPVRGKVFNYCYDTGVRLEPNENVVDFRCDVPEAAPTQLPSNQGYPPIGGQSSSSKCPLISQTYFVDQFVTSAPTGGTMETVEFELKPDVSYRRQAILQMKGQPFAQLGGLRVFLQTGYYRVEVRGSATVNYYNQLNSRQTRNFYTIFKDAFGAGEILDVLKEPGNPSLYNFQDCINKDALNAKAFWLERIPSLRGFVLPSEFSNNQYVFDPPVKEDGKIQGVMIIDSEHCGGMDRLSNVTPEYKDKKSGAVLNFAITRNNHSIKMFADRSNMKTFCAKINGIPVTADLTRVFPAETQRVSIPATIWILRKDIDISSLLSGLNSGTEENASITPDGENGTIQGKPLLIETKNGIAALFQEYDSGKKTEAMPLTPTADEIRGDGTTDVSQYFENIQDFLENCDKTEQELAASGHGTKPIIAKEAVCSQGSFGDAIYKNMGFDRLLFDWKWDSIADTTCSEIPSPSSNFNKIVVPGYKTDIIKSSDSKNNFCDAAQNGIALNKRQSRIKEFIEKNKSKFATITGIETSTKNIQRFAIQTIAVKDNAVSNTPTLEFYLKSDGTILESAPLDESSYQQVADIKKAEATQGNAYNILTKTQALLQSLESNPSKDNIVGEIETDITNNTKTMLNAIGVEDLQSENPDYANYGIITFEEYKKFHERVFAQLNANKCTPLPKENATTCTIQYGGTNVTVTANQLADLLKNVTFKIGVPVSGDLTLEQWFNIIAYGKTRSGIDSAKLKEVFFRDIFSYSLLVKDGYGGSYAKDFSAEYSGSNGLQSDFEKWNFKLDKADATGVEAGRYVSILNYNWVNGKTAVELSLQNPLSEIKPEYAKNAFFSLPIDGKMGEGSREGYGLSISGDAGNITFNNYANSSADGKVTGVEGKGIVPLKGAYGSTYAETKSGTVLNIAGGKISYNPSTAVSMNLTLAADDKTPEGLVYDLIDSENKPLKSLDSLITWSGKGNKAKQKDSLMAAAEAQKLCKQVNESHYGFITSISNDTTYDNTAVYLPYNNPYSMRIYCARGSADLSSRQYLDNSFESTNEQSGLSGFKNPSEAFSLQLNSTENAVDNYSIKKYIDFIKSGYTCISNAGQNSIGIAWNKAKITSAE